jgi:hypothetical protein
MNGRWQWALAVGAIRPIGLAFWSSFGILNSNMREKMIVVTEGRYRSNHGSAATIRAAILLK